MNDSSLPPGFLIGLAGRMAQGKNGVHLNDLVEALEQQGIAGWTTQALRVHLESAYRIPVRAQLKVGGVNSAGIHHAELPQAESEADTFPRPQDSPAAWVQCVARELGGRVCPQTAVIFDPVALCDYHRWRVASSLFEELSGHEARRRSEVMALHDAGQPVAPHLSGTHEEVVYFLLLGNRVKIGYTGSLSRRLSDLSLPRSSVKLTLAGGRALEQKLHAAFAFLRESPQSEWFRMEPPLSDYLHAKVTELAVLQLAHYEAGEDAPDVEDHPDTDAEPAPAPEASEESDLLAQAEEIVRSVGYASTSMLQRRLGLGYVRAGRLIDKLESSGFIGPHQGAGRPRPLLAPLTHLDGPEEDGRSRGDVPPEALFPLP